MRTTNVAARLQYLDEASLRLLTTSPALSAHLQGARQALADENGNEVVSHGSTWNCAACGSVMVPGLSCTSIRDPPRKRIRKDRLAKQEFAVKTVKLQCSRCDAITTIEAVKPERSRKVQVAQTRPTTSVHEDTAVENRIITKPTTESAEKTSRKRTRAKKSTSLQSMLAGQKVVKSKETQGFGLDLMDLMRS